MMYYAGQDLYILGGLKQRILTNKKKKMGSDRWVNPNRTIVLFSSSSYNQQRMISIIL
jgi:hypothetical protein